VPPLPVGDMEVLRPCGLHERTPLWVYCLMEADKTMAGKSLGPVGGRIVGEVMIGLLQGDPTSYLNQEPDWSPELAVNGRFSMVELLRFAKVVTTL
jgi:hypothetical protein